jgi:cell cycle checkpoint control protein RAD9A
MQWLLAILKRGASDKTVERCELSIVDPEVGGTEEEEDSLESKLIIRTYCKHGWLFSDQLIVNVDSRNTQVW